MATRVRWCDHVEPRTAVVSCGGERHRLTWRRGKLVLEDHDMAAELAMMALGGQPCACLKLLNLWRDLHSWRIPAQVFRRMQSGPSNHNLLAPGGLGAVTEVTLALTWERAWRREPRTSDHGALLEEQLRRRAQPPLLRHARAWRERTGARLVSSVQVRLARPGQPAELSGAMDSVAVTATATLGAGWLARVWARGVATVEDSFVLDVVADEGDGSAVVEAVRWEPAADGRWLPVSRRARAIVDATGDWRLSRDEGAAP